MSNNKALLGAVLGGAVAAAAYTLFATEKGKQIRNEIADNCDEFTETVQKFVVKLKENIEDNISDKTDEAKKTMKYVKKELKPYCNLDSKEARKGLVAGALIGALAGAAGTMFIQARSEQEESVLDNIANHACKWKSVLSDVLQAVDTKSEAKCQSNRMHEMLSFAASGLQLWQNLHKR